MVVSSRRSGSGRLERGVEWARAHPLLVDMTFALLLAATLGTLTVWLVFDLTSEPVVAGAPGVLPPWRPVLLAAVAAAHLGIGWR